VEMSYKLSKVFKKMKKTCFVTKFLRENKIYVHVFRKKEKNGFRKRSKIRLIYFKTTNFEYKKILRNKVLRENFFSGFFLIKKLF
jgi:hypothetical protein